MMLKRLAGATIALAVGVATVGAFASPGLATPAFPQATRAGPPPGEDHDVLADAVAGSQRSPANTARDPWRHPGASLTFWGLRPGDVILEMDPAGGYWTEILAPFAKATEGRYIGALADPNDPKLSDEQKQNSARFLARFSDPSVWGKVETTGFGPNSGPLAAPGSVDFILTGRNIHDFMWARDLDKMLADAFAALKPGGVLAVEEHRSDPRPMDPAARDGYVSEAFVIAAARRAGFVLDARSDINANSKDSKDHPFGVWTLPPTRRSSPFGQPPNPGFDHSRYDAIGESDRMTLRFRKPA
jgi:predicted methyltransferase